MIVVSSCLLGVNCKYNGKNNKNDKLLKFLDGKTFVGVCPESFGGLKAPRDPSEIEPGYSGEDVIHGKVKVLSKSGLDVTEEFVKGARLALIRALESEAVLAIFKESSPSCGVNKIYDGKFQNNKLKGEGVAASLFKENNIKVISEEDFELMTSDEVETLYKELLK